MHNMFSMDKNPCLCWISPAQTRILFKLQCVRVILPGKNNLKQIMLTQCSNNNTHDLTIRATTPSQTRTLLFQPYGIKQAHQVSITLCN